MLDRKLINIISTSLLTIYFVFKDEAALMDLKDLYKDFRNIELYVGGHAEVRIMLFLLMELEKEKIFTNLITLKI